MNHQLIIRPEAESEMAEAFDWYEERQPGLGLEFLQCVGAAFSNILNNPGQFPQIYRTIRRTLIRRFPYQVCFTINDRLVVILSVFHAKRDPKRWQNRI